MLGAERLLSDRPRALCNWNGLQVLPRYVVLQDLAVQAPRFGEVAFLRAPAGDGTKSARIKTRAMHHLYSPRQLQLFIDTSPSMNRRQTLTVVGLDSLVKRNQERRLHLLRKESRNNVAGATRGKANHDARRRMQRLR